MKELLSRALVMWRLVRLYKFVLLAFFLITQITPVHSAATSHKNWLVFKVVDQVYFFNDLEKFYNDLDSYNCSMPDSMIFKVIKLNFKKAEKEQIKATKEHLKERAPFEGIKGIINELKLLLKIENYLNSQKVVVAQGLDQQILKLGKSSSCKVDNKDLPTINRLLKVEVFLKSRFNPKSVWVTDDEVKKIQSTQPKMSINEIKEKELERKINESIEMFTKTLDRQVSHEDFW